MLDCDVENFDNIGYSDKWIDVVQIARTALSSHPWILKTGPKAELIAQIGIQSTKVKDRIGGKIGRAIRSGADDVFASRMGPFRPPDKGNLPFLTGEVVRDWQAVPVMQIYYPYVYGTKTLTDTVAPEFLWPWRTNLMERQTFDGNISDSGIVWWAYMQHTASAYATPRSIAFAEISSGANFALVGPGIIFKQTSPVLKFRPEVSDDDIYSLLSILN